MKNIIDISSDFDSTMATWPSSEKFDFQILRNHHEHNVQVSRISLNLHTGSHIDAPKHFDSNGLNIDEIPLETFLGEVYVFDCGNADIIDKNVLLNLNFAPQYKRIIFKTKNSKDKSKVFNENYVALTTEAAEYLASLNLLIIGIDAPSIELYKGRNYKTHQVILNKKIVIIEGLNLENVEQGVYKLIALPLKIKNAEASPVRAILIKE
jgi:arylformamidase